MTWEEELDDHATKKNKKRETNNFPRLCRADRRCHTVPKLNSGCSITLRQFGLLGPRGCHARENKSCPADISGSDHNRVTIHGTLVSNRSSGAP